MKYTYMLLVLIAATSVAQTRHKIDWKACEDLQAEVKDKVEQFNVLHNKEGYSAWLDCSFGGDPARIRKPEQHIALTPEEVKLLHLLRRNEDAAFDAMGHYERFLYRAHHVRNPDISEPCYYFVGIAVDTDYITVDPNPIAGGFGNCP